jgi:hypothetical protein
MGRIVSIIFNGYVLTVTVRKLLQIKGMYIEQVLPMTVYRLILTIIGISSLSNGVGGR